MRVYTKTNHIICCQGCYKLGKEDKEKELSRKHDIDLVLINKQNKEDLDFQRKELIEDFEKIIFSYKWTNNDIKDIQAKINKLKEKK